jgi:hypothetical protein
MPLVGKGIIKTSFHGVVSHSMYNHLEKYANKSVTGCSVGVGGDRDDIKT